MRNNTQNHHQTRNRNEPGRFFGDGVSFKAKLIGILEVGEARGDRMCQEALQDLKMAIRAAGEHKQRITIHVTIDGLRLRDEKTGDSLYHHPVHKISFIAQDMTDSRAFGYIFGSPDSGHRFFGIKTDKAASQVVLAMRDLFQVVFELKKKEIELARQHIQSKITAHEHQAVAMAMKNTSLDAYSKSMSDNASGGKSSVIKNEKSPESVADLVDLEQELSSIQRGITQMERITPNEVPSNKSVLDDDPFGDSFTNIAPPTYNILPPPPESSTRRHQKTNRSTEHLPPTNTEMSTEASSPTAPPVDNDDWLNVPNSRTSGFDSDKFSDELNEALTPHNLSSNSAVSASFLDVFTDLDPLGTGKIKPYVDKKFFFHELKNPPKKVLKELSGKESFDANFSGGEDKLHSTSNGVSEKMSNNDLFKATFEDSKNDTELFDPFSNKNIDPFNDDDDFSKLSIDPFDLHFSSSRMTSPRERKQSSEEQACAFRGHVRMLAEEETKSKAQQQEDSKNDDDSVFNGPLQVSLPPESWANYISHQKRIERQHSESSSPSLPSSARNRPSSVFKQNTVDVISSLSSKKMKPNIFSQKFSKRDSNSINMRRLQESDSLSENEAPEPPPRPDSGSHIEPPPLPPKKQFADIVIRPTPRSTGSSLSSSTSRERYDYIGSKFSSSNKSQNDKDAPPLPLPSRKVGRTDSNGPSPARPYRKPNEDDDYLTPIGGKSDIPTLLPPPPQRRDATKTRAARKSETDPRNLDEPMRKTPPADMRFQGTSAHAYIRDRDPILPDITLSQLLTLGIDELANKLNVPVSKLNTMTLVELTTYLSDFIESSKKPASKTSSWNKDLDSAPMDSPVFKVSFDDASDATFVAKFDDNFGEDSMANFVANFEHFEKKISSIPVHSAPAVDKYAMLREIIEKEIQPSPSIEESTGGEINDFASLDFHREVAGEMTRLSPNISSMNQSSSQQNLERISPLNVPIKKIDTKITEAISHAKDRYAALRDIILVEDLFEKPPKAPLAKKESSSFEDRDEFDDQRFDANFDDMEEMKTPDQDTSPEINISEPVMDEDLVIEEKSQHDLEIDEFMRQAVSNLSLHSIGPSPAPHFEQVITNKSPIQIAIETASPNGHTSSIENIVRATLSDMGTSPIPIAKSPSPKSPLSKSPLNKVKSPSPSELNIEAAASKRSSGSISDVCESPAEVDNEKVSDKQSKQTPTPESWAVFDQTEEPIVLSKEPVKHSKEQVNKNGPDSPCSSDPKEEWKEPEYNRKWPTKGQTSSSSRDVSPWDEEGEYRRRPPPGHHTSSDRYHQQQQRYPGGRRINSCDEDFEDEMEKHHQRRRNKNSITRSRDNFEQPEGWSPTEDEDNPGRSRSFDRNAYERSTYGPPYEKREPKSLPPYERRDYKSYDKRKYYRDRGRPEYDYEPYAEPYKGRQDYEEIYDRRDSRGGTREYFYDRDRKSFDRDSNESYDSGRVRRTFGSGDIYGSFEGREYQNRDRYLSLDKSRSARRMRRTIDDPDQDSEGEIVTTRRSDTSSLHRSSQNIRGKQIIDDDIWGPTEQQTRVAGNPAAQKPWKRPSSASEQERRYSEGRRMLGNMPVVGSDGEKDRRFRKKNRARSGKDNEIRPNYATFGRYPYRQKGEDYYDYEDDGREFENEEEDESGRIQTEDSPSYYQRRQPYYKPTTPRTEGRTMSETLESKKVPRFEFEDDERRRMKKSNSRDLYFEGEVKDNRYTGKFGSGNFEEPPKSGKYTRKGFEYDGFGESGHITSKFNFEDASGFESDFNSPPPAPPTSSGQTPQTGSSASKSFRFSNDFSEKGNYQNVVKTVSQQSSNSFSFEADFSAHQTPPPAAQSKLRFNENVTVSKFDTNSNTSHMFEDDFGAGRAEEEQELEDQWNAELPPSITTNGNKKILKTTQLSSAPDIKKSESVNIFAKKVDDPFEDDDFFSSGGKNANKSDPFNSSNQSWEKNFANFDDNI